MKNNENVSQEAIQIEKMISMMIGLAMKEIEAYILTEGRSPHPLETISAWEILEKIRQSDH